MRIFEYLLTLSEEEQLNEWNKRCDALEDKCDGNCCKCIMTWFASEHAETKHYTKEEVALAKMLDKKYKWVTRDKNGDVYAYNGKPIKHREIWFANGSHLEITPNFVCDFPSVKWEDDEPTSLDEIRNYKE